MSNNPTIVARNLGKTYYLTKGGEDRGLGSRKNRVAIEALKPLSFIARSGESIGVIGRNGSGKSTLFSLLAGNESPTQGEVLVRSEPTLLSVSAALQPHLTAPDNVRLGLLAKGILPKEVEQMKHEVAAWADIGTAIDRPLRTYSSGMAARLKFSIATAVKPDILLVDEALATGDSAFNARAEERMNSFLEQAGTVLLVTHSISTIRNQCTRAIWLHEGELIADGSSEEVTHFYRTWSKHLANQDRIKAGQIIRRVRNDYIPKKIYFNSEIV